MSVEPRLTPGQEDVDRCLRREFATLSDLGWMAEVESRVWTRMLVRHPYRPRWLRLATRPPLVAAIVLLVSVSMALAVNNLVDLGKPTSTLAPNPYFPLSGFHRIGTYLGSPRQPEVLFIGTQLGMPGLEDGASAAERWAVVKALDQFGSWSGIVAANSICQTDSFSHTAICPTPTYNWQNARFVSVYLRFVHKDLLATNGRPLQTLSPAELPLYDRYSRQSGSYPYHIGIYRYRDPYNAAWSIAVRGRHSRGLPLILIGNYLQTISQLLSFNDFVKAVPEPVPTSPNAQPQGETTGLPFDTVQQALVSGKSPRSDEFLVTDVNAEANIMTALICHADGKRPASVCGRSTIRQILKYVK